MKKIFAILTAFGLCAGSAFGQGTGKITGSVASGSKPVEAATIALLNVEDSSLIKQIPSSKTGAFTVEGLATGKYILRVTAVGYATKYSNVELTAENLSSNLAEIELAKANKALTEVVVTAKKPMIEQKPGKTIVNVDASPSNAGISALDLLEKSPGISVDKDGNVNLRGKSGVMILIDGKPSYLSSADLVNMLRNMQSNNIDQIEIMTNPPARYDAAGNSGIINIKTKKNTTRGTNGNASVTYSQGIYGRSNNNISLNHRNNKVNIFTSYGFSRYEGFNDLRITRKFLEADKKTVAGTADQISKPHWFGYNHNAKVGVDYNLSKKDVLGVVVNGNFSNGKEDPFSTSNVRDAEGRIIYSLRSENDNAYTFANISSNINYKHTFDSSGKEITADVDHVYYNKKNNTLLTTRTFDAHGNQNAAPVALKGIFPSDINIYSFKSDYVHPFSKTMKLEAGVKTSIVKTDNKVDYTRNQGSSQWFADDRSNHFLYDENINAAYLTLTRNMKKWNVIAGLRLENTIAKGTQVKTDSSFERNYTNLFPNLGIGYEASIKHQFNLSYSRRINRPDYDDLNPFTFFLDSLTYGQGNPYLQPQLSNNFEFTHSFNRFLTTTLNYSQTNNVITQLLKQDTERKITYQTRENVSMMRQYGLTVMVNKPVTKWWNTNVFVNVFNNHYTGFYQADPIDIQFTSLQTNINNNFTFKNGWSAELSGFYRSKSVDGLLVAREMYAVNMGVSKQVLKKKGTVRLVVRDIFYTQIFSGYARYSDVDVDLSSRRDSRQVSLGFTYRFGKTNFAPAKRKSGGASDEQNRVKGGGNG
ncbi:TonB-dependent receptor [Aridibaculum aurantiacum]|uniref:TonB-dependent receptor n=1 Tax=Aridibaculum aurantiacum TaxID=2810307 RepID=UPI001A979C45|nr:TonB-dependent receptor [Aridibaculum aurantiacum]